MARRAPLPDELVTSTCPVPGLVLRDFVGEDAAELLVLQRCCWVQEALANDTLDEVLEWGRTWLTLVGRLDHRLVTAVRARSVGCTWQISRLMVAPDLAGRGVGSWLLSTVEGLAPPDADTFTLLHRRAQRAQPPHLSPCRLHGRRTSPGLAVARARHRVAEQGTAADGMTSLLAGWCADASTGDRLPLDCRPRWRGGWDEC